MKDEDEKDIFDKFLESDKLMGFVIGFMSGALVIYMLTIM